jgi:hypothetical protein
VGAVPCAHAIGDLILKFLSALFSLNLPEQLLPLLTFLVILFHSHARLGYNAAAPGTKFAVASPNFAAGAYLRHTLRCSLCTEEKLAASSS